MAFKDSVADCPQPLKAPKGAPNVLLLMGDDIGYGHMSAFGGPANTPTFDRIAASLRHQVGIRLVSCRRRPESQAQ